MKKSISSENVSTEQLVNLIDERTQKALKQFKKELDKKPFPKKNNNCSPFKKALYLLEIIMLLLQALYLL